MLAAIVIAVSTIATIAIAAFVLGPRQGPERIIFDSRPDLPRAFGVRMSWIAIRTRETQRVVAALGLTDLEYANWATGLGSVYSPELCDRYVFVSPPINGWTFVAGSQLPQPLGEGFSDKAIALMQTLGRDFIEVQYYLSYPALDMFGWCRVIDGRIVRAFSITEAGQAWNFGRVTKEEKLLGLQQFAPRSTRAKPLPAPRQTFQQLGEFHVQQMAAHWGISPMRIKTVAASPAVGIVGRPPAHWRPELERKAA